LICEARSHNVNKLEKQTKHMINAVNNAVRNSEININKKRLMAKSNETIIREFDGISVGKDEFPAILAYKAIEKAGLKPRFEQSGGGSDANILNGKGIKTVILGTGMSNVHTKEEFIKVKNLIEIAEIVENIIRLSYE
ncbi:M20/M25/M40 family metallo-hydrolase, partial [candidate division WOR-3 bacterium]|nr:M20/M25/M40 family metallo-hydrolase [candidate division WOR-3 bacterium]